MNYKIRITGENQAIVKRIANENGMNPTLFDIDIMGEFYGIENNKIQLPALVEMYYTELTTEQFIELFDKKETELDKWLRETKAKNLSLEKLKIYITNRSSCDDDLYKKLIIKLDIKGGISLADFLFNQWNNPIEPHICKYCGAETTQDDETCYAKPTEWHPKKGDRVLVWDEFNLNEYERIFIGINNGETQPIRAVSLDYEKAFLSGDKFQTCNYDYMKPLPIEQPKKDKVAEVAYQYCKKLGINNSSYSVDIIQSFINGAKWQSEQPKETDFKTKVIELIETKINDLKGYEKRQIEINEYYNNHSQVASKIKVYNDLINDIKQL
jgi:hypothetical protein